MKENPKNYPEDLTEVELETDDDELFHFLECFRDVPPKFLPIMSDVFLLVDKKFNISREVETLQELVDRNIALKGSIFEIIETGETWVFNGIFATEGGDAIICAPLGSPLLLSHIPLTTRIKNVF